MLVLTRKKNESLIIDGQVLVKILGVKGGRIRLGIEAPKRYNVRRGELKPKEKPLPQSV